MEIGYITLLKDKESTILENMWILENKEIDLHGVSEEAEMTSALALKMRGAMMAWLQVVFSQTRKSLQRASQMTMILTMKTVLIASQ